MKPNLQLDAEVSNSHRQRRSDRNSRNSLIILQEPRDVTTSIGTHISLSTVVYSNNPSFQWYDRSGRPIPNENEKDLFIGPVKKRDFGFYKLEILDTGTGERKYTRWTEVKDLKNARNSYEYNKPKLVVSPEKDEHDKGTTIHLFGAFDNALDYQWYKNEEMIQGCKGNNLVISECVRENSGRYVLLGRNLDRIESSEEVTITIK